MKNFMKYVLSGGMALMVFAVADAVGAEETEKVQSTAYLFSSFRGNGEDGLHLAYSEDGLKWTPLNGDKSFLKPTIGNKLMRDPCVCQGPDGTFYLAWTTGWNDNGIGIAHSKDLINWSEQQYVPVMKHEPKALNCWAPEIFYDDKTDQFVIFWATTIPGRFAETEKGGDDSNRGKLNHRMYYVTTKDFKSYSDTKLFYDDGFSVIDATLVKDGDKYVLFVKDETKKPAKKHIRIATADAALGPYGQASKAITPDWVEGPSVVKIGDRWIVYFDEYTRHKYGAIASTDMKDWENISEQISFPKGTRHGTAFVVKRAALENLLHEAQ